MAINKKLIHFETLTKFQSADGINTTSATQSADANLLVGNIPYHSIVFIKDVCKFWTHGKYYDCNNTWRGIQNNLTSTSTTDSLSAYQGKILNEKFANYLPLSGGTLTGALTVPSLTVTGASSFSQAINASILGNAATASRLLNARNIAISGAVTGNANFDGSGNITISTSVNHTHSYAGSSSAGGAATNVVVNSGNNSASTYPLVWHSGNTLYSTADVYVNPSTDVIYNKGVETTGRVKAKSGNNMVQLIPDSDCGLYMTSSGQWLHIAGSGSNMYIYNGTWDSPGTGNYNKGIIIDTSNNIGIGSSTISYKLHVGGTIYSSSDIIANSDIRAKGNDLYIGSASGSQCHQQYDSTNKVLKFLFD